MRDLGLATAVDGIVVLPKFFCHCDRYWGFLTRCRMPMVQEMALFNCPMDSLYDAMRWNKKGVKLRAHLPPERQRPARAPRAARARERRRPARPAAAAAAAAAPRGNRTHVELPYGTPMSAVGGLVKGFNPDVRVIDIANADLRRLCRTLGSARRNAQFNLLVKYIMTESSRYCPQEDMGGWRAGLRLNPFTAYNCMGFHHPAPFPERDDACASPTGGAANDGGVLITERSNSTTCPRQMLCDYNTLPDGRETKPITWCNIEGYNGMRQEYLPTTRAMLAKMPDGRCPYPPGDRPGMIGFDRHGHYVGT